jgi:hypothetical protein
MGMLTKKSQLKPPLSENNKLKRLEYANQWMKNGLCILDNVIWTDETRVASHPNNRRISVQDYRIYQTIQSEIKAKS